MSRRPPKPNKNGKTYFGVNWDDPEDLERFIQKFKERRRVLVSTNPNKKTKAQRALEKFEARMEIWNSEFTFSSESLDPEPRYYVYVHYVSENKNGSHPLTKFCKEIGLPAVPMYVGKGTGDRFNSGTRNKGHQLVRRVKEGFKQDFEEFIFRDNLTEGEALAIEGKLIDTIGQKIIAAGPLTNLDEGYHPKFRRRHYIDALGRLNDIFRRPPTLGSK